MNSHKTHTSIKVCQHTKLLTNIELFFKYKGLCHYLEIGYYYVAVMQNGI